jgi:hypothetical protein
MLPLPDLDDRVYEHMLQEARKAIPKLFPLWTDENAHDPGMTMLELMTWMTEMQQYYLNRITADNERKFLRLLGVKPKEATSAACEVAFSGAASAVTIPRGTPLLAFDQTFETDETLRFIPAVLEKVIVRTVSAVGDFTSNLKAGIAFYAFGQEAAADSRLFIGFDRELPLHTDIVLSIRLSDQYPVPLGHGAEGQQELPLIASSSVSWKYASGDEGDSWKPVETVADSTAHLSRTGKLVFRLTEPMKPIAMHPADDKARYWICCTLEQDGYELAPKLEHLCINTVQAVQQQTICEYTDITPSGEPGFECEVTGYLAYGGSIAVQVMDGDSGRWRSWEPAERLNEWGEADARYELKRDHAGKSVTLRFGDGVHGMMPDGSQMIRIIQFDPVKEDRLWVGASDGLPDQQFDISRSGEFMRSGMRLQVAERDAVTGRILWIDWQRVSDFDHSLSTDCHYTYERTEGIIRFGNNEQGRIPARSEAPNIRFIALRMGGGARGNVKKEMINAFIDYVPEWSAITVTNQAAATGGAEEETIDAAKLRMQQELLAPARAVTAEDYEAIAGNTPGLRVARAKAIPLYKPGMRDYPREKAAAQMTVVVVPYSEAALPKAGPGFLETVRRHLDRHRLLTTELHVISAAYIRVTVRAVVVVEPAYKESAAFITNVLKRLLRPIGHGDGEGWRFGRSVYKGDIYGAISRLKGVVYVQDLWIDAEGPSVRKDGAGDVHLQPYGLVYSGEHEVELVGVSDL